MHEERYYHIGQAVARTGFQAPLISPVDGMEAGRADGFPRLRRALLAGLVALLVILADQLSTSWALSRLSKGPIHVVGPLSLSLGMNTGFSFGIARGNSPIIAVVALLFVVVLAWMTLMTKSMPLAAAYGMIIGGALGNLADRVFRANHGAVVDFIHLRYWPTFNVADACIDIGVLLVVVVWTAQSIRTQRESQD